MAMFVVTEMPGPNWDNSRSRRDQSGWDEHARFMDSLVAEGFVVLGGPVGDGERVLLAIEAADEQELRGRLVGDPWIAAGVLELALVKSWSIWLDARQSRESR
jgi:hypothetical protein